jgi:TetR/AcrR family transcriptional regulator, mexJK operon transcriptional repressor
MNITEPMPDSYDRHDTPQTRIDLDLPRVPQQARSRRKCDAILAATSRLFAERGYDATTADDIAAAAGVSVGTFYAYFRNKRQAFLMLYAEHHQAVLALEIGALDLAADPRQAIRALLTRALRFDESFEGLRRASQELRLRDPEIAAYHQQQMDAIYRQLLAAAGVIQAQGLAWPGLDIEATCWMITALLPPFLLVPPGTVFEYERWVRAMIDLIYRALFRTSI